MNRESEANDDSMDEFMNSRAHAGIEQEVLPNQEQDLLLLATFSSDLPPEDEDDDDHVVARTFADDDANALPGTESINSAPRAQSKSQELTRAVPRSVLSMGDERTDMVHTATEMDVILGRGGHTAHHPGNRTYNQLKQGLQKEYHSSSKRGDKKRISQRLVKLVKDRGGRFLEQVSDGVYSILNDEEAATKAGQALREKRIKSKAS